MSIMQNYLVIILVSDEIGDYFFLSAKAMCFKRYQKYQKNT